MLYMENENAAIEDEVRLQKVEGRVTGKWHEAAAQRRQCYDDVGVVGCVVSPQWNGLQPRLSVCLWSHVFAYGARNQTACKAGKGIMK